MGVIKRQGIKHTMVNLFGVAIGLLSTIFVYPRATELYGLAQIFIGGSILLMSFFSLGLNAVTIKYFPVFKNEDKKHHGFLGFLLIGVTLGFVLFLICLPFIRWIFLDVLFANNDNRELLSENFLILIPIVFLMLFNFIFLKYTSNFHRIVVPTILDQILIKVSLPVLVLLYLFQFIDLDIFLLGIVANYVFVLIGFIIYITKLGQFHISMDKSFLTKPLRKEISEYSFFGILNALGSQLAFRIDTLMVAGLVSISSGGIYAIVHVIIDVISKPLKAIIAIASPIISEKWIDNDVQGIESIYQKSSILLLLLGVYIFLGIWLSIDDLFLLMPNTEEMSRGKYVVFFLGIAKMIDLGTSVNSQIIAYSEKYKFNFYALMILACANIIFNLVFIPEFQMVGAAIATLCSISLFNLAKVIYLRIKFGLQPFKSKTIVLVLLATVTYFACSKIPLDFHPFWNIIIRSIVLTILYVGGAYLLKISKDFNGIMRGGIKSLKF